MSSYLDTTLMGGMRHRTHRKRGMGILSDIISSVGLGRKRYHKKRGGSVKVAHKPILGLGKRRHRVRRGKGIFDKIKSGLTSALKFAGPIVGSAILGKAGNAIGSKVFGGRKRRTVHRKKSTHVSLASLIQKLKGGRRHRKRV